jgi:hypothetical protein
MSPKSPAEKLLIKPNASVWSSPPERLQLVGPLPPGAEVVDRPRDATVALLFVDDARSLRDAVAVHAPNLAAPDMLWVAYPKGNRTDINRDTVWPVLAEHGMRPITQVAIDDVWSALRFRPLRPGEAPFRADC